MYLHVIDFFYHYKNNDELYMIINHGVRGSIPNPSQNNSFFGGNTPCVEIRTQKYQLIFDCGSGFSKINLSNDLKTILFISHFHHDHIQGLAFNNYDFLPKNKITITSAHSNKTDTYNNLAKYYSSPYFPVNFFEILNTFNFLEFDQVVNNNKELNIKSIDLNHPGKSFGYSITSNNKKFCYLLDNEYEDFQEKKLAGFCNDSDTVIWDGMFLDDELSEKKGWGHSSIEQGVNFASKIKVNNFLISHHLPTRNDKEINKLESRFSNNNIKFASENKVTEF